MKAQINPKLEDLFDLAKDHNFNVSEADELLKRGQSLDSKILWTYPLLFRAAEYNNKRFVDWMLEHGADINIIDLSCNTAAMFLTERINLSEEAVLSIEFLLSKPNVNINLVNREGYSILNLACLYNKVKVVEIILDKFTDKANVNLANKWGKTPLDETNYWLNRWNNDKSVIAKQIEVKLIQAGADNNLKELPYLAHQANYSALIRDLMIFTHPNWFDQTD